MPKIASTFNVGDREDLTPEKLLVLMERMYKDLAEAINLKPDFYERTVNGQTSDTFLAQGTLNLNSNTKKVEMLTSHVDASNVSWTQLS